MSKGWEIYQELLADLRRECDEMVKNGELTEEDAAFRYDMVKDEILDSMPDELFMVDHSDADAALKWNRAEDGHCRLNGCPCFHEGCEGCPVENCYSYPASYEKG